LLSAQLQFLSLAFSNFPRIGQLINFAGEFCEKSKSSTVFCAAPRWENGHKSSSFMALFKVDCKHEHVKFGFVAIELIALTSFFSVWRFQMSRFMS
jgi:hypothetical protein